VRKLLLSTLALAVMLGAANLCLAKSEMKPLVTVSFSGYDKLMTNVGVVGQLGGNPDLGKGLEMMLQMVTQGKGLAGLDTKRPWGAVLLTDDQGQFAFYGFVPVTDLKQLVKLSEVNPQLADAIKLTDGVYEIQAGVSPIFIEQKGTWALISNKREDLANAPANPLALLGDLPKNYDLAVRASVKNAPKEYRDQMIAQLEAGAEAGMPQMPGESDDDYALRATAARQAVQQVTTLVNELEDVMLGWNVDPSTSTTHLDLALTAQTGTKLADQFAKIKPGKTDFAGFMMPDAAVTANSVGTLSDADVARAKNTLATLRKSILSGLKKQHLSEDEIETASQLIGDVMDVLEKTIETKKSDGGMAILLDPDAVTLVGGGAIAEGDKLEKALKQLVDEIKKTEPEAAESIKFNAGTHQGVRLHTLSVPTPQVEMAPFVGDTLEVVIGIADNKVVMAAGRNAMKTLKKALDDSKAAAGKEVPPMRISLAAGSIAQFVAAVADDEQIVDTASMLAGALEAAKGTDHVTITATPIAQGIRVRLEIEQGLLKVLASMGQMLSPMGSMGGGAPGGF